MVNLLRSRHASGTGNMEFNEQEFLAKLDKATTTEEFRDLVGSIPLTKEDKPFHSRHDSGNGNTEFDATEFWVRMEAAKSAEDFREALRLIPNELQAEAQIALKERYRITLPMTPELLEELERMGVRKFTITEPRTILQPST